MRSPNYLRRHHRYIILFSLTVLSVFLSIAPWSIEARSSSTDIPRSERGERFSVAALVLPNIRWDRERALERIVSYTRRAASQGAKIVVTPETCLDGYCCHQPELTKERFVELAESEQEGPSIIRLRKLARELDIYLCIGFTEREGQQLYNTALLIGPDGTTAGKYRKTHGVEPGYTPGDRLPVFETRYGKVGMLICYDRQPPEIARTLAQHGAELILIPSNGMWGRMNDALLRSRAYENRVYLVFAHPRNGVIIDPGGRIIAANMSIPGQGVGLPTNSGTEDNDGWPEAVVRDIDLVSWRGFTRTIDQLRPDLYQ